MLAEDLAAPRKQRHTARRVFERLAAEHGARVSYSCVAKYVARRRAEIAAEDRGQEAGLAGFVAQAREPGAEAEADFGDVPVELAGQLTRCFMFAFRLSCSGKGVHRVYASQAQEAFLGGHVTAFEATGGVPFRQIRHDNLSPAVAKVQAGQSRTESDPRAQALAGALANMLCAVTGITNKSLRALMTGLLGNPYGINQASYDLGRLARNGLIARVPHRNLYTLTPDGLRSAICYTKVHDRLLRPLMAVTSPKLRPPSGKPSAPSTARSPRASRQPAANQPLPDPPPKPQPDPKTQDSRQTQTKRG
jgi:hypothetical protein